MCAEAAIKFDNTSWAPYLITNEYKMYVHVYALTSFSSFNGQNDKIEKIFGIVPLSIQRCVHLSFMNLTSHLFPFESQKCMYTLVFKFT